MAVGVILGSSFSRATLAGVPLKEQRVTTRHGEVVLHRHPDHEAWALFRHGVPHRWLPNQIDYRAQAAALAEVGCAAVLVTSSVGVIDPEVPLFAPLIVRDLVMLENRLPDGSACSMFPAPHAEHGHLIVDGGLLDAELSQQVGLIALDTGHPIVTGVEFTYVQGPRTKTNAENALLARLGAQVNSMSLGPEVVLLNELEVATAGLVVGHKKSRADEEEALDQEAIAASLVRAKDALERIALAFLERGTPVPFKNRLHRFSERAT
jgi:5'-methylthioadenosine phosphorylase